MATQLVPSSCSVTTPENHCVSIAATVASGERPVPWRLAIVAGAWRLLQCCELWNCDYEAPLAALRARSPGCHAGRGTGCRAALFPWRAL